MPSFVKNSFLFWKKLNRFLLVSLLFLCTHSLSATVYYVSATGIDTNSGTSTSAPWKTLSKVNSFTPKAGDQILFKRGDEWTGTITVKASGTAGSPITFGAYGTGNKPIITGFTTIISGWTETSTGSHFYWKSIPVESAPQMVTIDGVQYAKGRWPNVGWRTITGVSGKTQISDSGLTGTPDWTGAEVAIRTSRWTIEKRTITSQKTTQLNFSATQFSITTGWGYFIQNSLSALDAYGEWYYNTGTGIFYMYFGSVDPTTKTVKVSTIDKCIVSANKAYITIDGIDFSGANTQSIYLYPAPTYTNVKNCNVTFSGGTGIYMHYPHNCSVTNSTFNYSNFATIWFDGDDAPDNTISNNTISNTGLIVGGAGVEGASYSAIISKGLNGLIEYNTITNTGYIPIHYGGKNTVIKNNFIDTYCSVLDDGGGIYCHNDTASGKQVLNNIVLNSIGNFTGTDANFSKANGLYSDGFSKHIIYSGNTLSNITKYGFHSNMSADADITIINNTFFQVLTLISIQRWPESGFVSRFTLKNNIFVTTAIDPTQGTFKYNVNMDGQDLPFYNGSLINEVSHIGTIDSNYYYTDIDKAALVYSSAPHSSYKNYTISSWKSTFGYDANSTFITGTSDPNYYQFEYNATKSDKIITLAQPMVDLKGVKYNSSITLKPFTSAVLTKVTNVTPVTGVIISPTSTSISVNATQQLTATVSPSNATNKTVAWSSSNASVATVSSTGLVTGVSAGSATITVTTQDGGKTASSVINVSINEFIGLKTVGSVSEINIKGYWIATSFTSGSNISVNRMNLYVGTASGNARLGLYSSVSGQPGILLAQTSEIMLSNGWNSGMLNVPQTLTSGATYWLAFEVNSAATTLYSNTETGRQRYLSYAYGPLPSSAPTGLKTGTGIYSIFADNTGIPVTGVSVSPTTATVSLGATQQLTATVSPSNATNKTVTWSSNNTSIASVNSTGIVTGVSAGSATITVTTQDGGKAATSVITVTIPVTGVSVSPTTDTVSVGATQQLTTTVLPLDATNKTVTWSSDNTSVATVNSTGLVTGLAPGSATITVTTQDGGKTATCEITVIIPVSGVSVSPISAAISVNATQQLTATVSPSDATNKSVTWSSNNTSVAIVNSTGLVTGVSAGSATITVTTQDGSKTAATAININSDESIGLKTVGSGSENNIKGIWIATSFTAGSNISVNRMNLYVGTASGNARLGLYSSISGQPGTLLAQTGEIVLSNGWNSGILDVPQTLTSGATYWLAFEVNSSATTLYYNSATGRQRYLSYAYGPMPSSAPMGLKTGTGIYSIYADNTWIPVTGVSVSPTTASVSVNATQQLTATIFPSNATIKTVTWSSNNTSVAIVNNTGLVTGVSAGNATITISTQDGGKTSTTSINVSSNESIGLKTVGSGSQINIKGIWIATSFTAGSNISVNRMNLYVGTASGNARLGLYSSISGLPGTLLAQTGEILLSNGWNSSMLDVPQTLTSGATYWLVFEVNSAATTLYYNTSSGRQKYKSYAYGPLPLTAPTGLNSGSGIYSIYADFFTITTSVSAVSVSPTTATVSVNATQQLTATVLPSDAINKTIVWSSDNTSVATVSSDGLVTGVSAGSASITATTQDGGKTATSVITVIIPIKSANIDENTKEKYKITEIENNFMIFPNPAAEGVLYINLAKVNENATINIFDLIGQVVLNKTVENNSGTLQLDISTLKMGLYLVKVKQDSSSYSSKLIIEKRY